MKLGFVSFTLKKYTLDGQNVLPFNAGSLPVGADTLLVCDLPTAELWLTGLCSRHTLKSRDYFPYLRHLNILDESQLLTNFRLIQDVFSTLSGVFPQADWYNSLRVSLALQKSPRFLAVQDSLNARLAGTWKQEPYLFEQNFLFQMPFTRSGENHNCLLVPKQTDTLLKQIRAPAGTLHKIDNPASLTYDALSVQNQPVWVKIGPVEAKKSLAAPVRKAVAWSFQSYWNCTALLREWISLDEYGNMKAWANMRIEQAYRASAWDAPFDDLFPLPPLPQGLDSFSRDLCRHIICYAWQDIDESHPLHTVSLPFAGLLNAALRRQTTLFALQIASQGLNVVSYSPQAVSVMVEQAQTAQLAALAADAGFLMTV